MVEVHTTIWVNDIALDGSLVPLPVRLVHGRNYVEIQPDPPQAEFHYWSTEPPCQIGDAIRIGTVGGIPPKTWGDASALWADPTYTWFGTPAPGTSPRAPGQTWDRFHGWASQIVATERDGELVDWYVLATGNIARLGQMPVYMERPVEDDVTRVLAIAAEVGVEIRIAGDPSLMLAIDQIDRSALGAVQEICRSTGGLFWQGLDGTFWYGTSNHRAEATKYVLPAWMILDGVSWEENVNSIINAIKVIYPAPPLPPILPTGQWNWVTSTDTGSDPGSGNLRTNSDANSVTTIAISAWDADGNNLRNVIKKINILAKIYIANPGNPDQFAWYTATGQAIDNGGWFQLSVDFKDDGTAGVPVAGGRVVFTADTRTQEELNSIEMEDTASIAIWGYRHLDAETLVADDTQAAVLAATVLSRRAYPYWAMPGVIVPYEEVTDSEYAALQNLDVSVGVLVPVEIEPNPTPAPVAQWAVEGLVEEWRQDGYWVQIAMSDWARTSSGTINSWQVVRDANTWAQAATMSYRELLVEVTP